MIPASGRSASGLEAGGSPIGNSVSDGAEGSTCQALFFTAS